MLTKIVYKKYSKILKNEKNERCAYTNIFKRVVDMILVVFVGSNTPLAAWATSHPNIMAVRLT